MSFPYLAGSARERILARSAGTPLRGFVPSVAITARVQSSTAPLPGRVAAVPRERQPA